MTEKETIMLKFLESADCAERNREIRAWLGEALLDSAPLFAEIDDVDLSTIYEVHVRKGSDVDQLLEKLQNQSEIEYVHIPKQRTAK